jgi:hypothetical protein
MKDGKTILTLHPEKGVGVRISKSKYILLRDYIVTQLNVRYEVTFQELLASSGREIPHSFGTELAWHLLVVKLDLEARGIIKTRISVQFERNQVIKLKRKRKI